MREEWLFSAVVVTPNNFFLHITFINKILSYNNHVFHDVQKINTYVLQNSAILINVARQYFRLQCCPCGRPVSWLFYVHDFYVLEKGMQGHGIRLSILYWHLTDLR